jgi:hypothetical protein
MLVSHFLFGKRRGGYTRMIRADGSSGIVDIIWVAEYMEKMRDKSNVGV